LSDRKDWEDLQQREDGVEHVAKARSDERLKILPGGGHYNSLQVRGHQHKCLHEQANVQRAGVPHKGVCDVAAVSGAGRQGT